MRLTLSKRKRRKNKNNFSSYYFSSFIFIFTFGLHTHTHTIYTNSYKRELVVGSDDGALLYCINCQRLYNCRYVSGQLFFFLLYTLSQESNATGAKQYLRVTKQTFLLCILLFFHSFFSFPFICLYIYTDDDDDGDKVLCDCKTKARVLQRYI